MFRGDSHSRQLFSATTMDACPSGAAASAPGGSIVQTELGAHVFYFNSSECQKNLSGVCHLSDRLGECKKVTPLRNLVVTNFGLHNMLKMWTIQDFSQALETIVADASDGWVGRFAWHEINAVAHRKDVWTLAKGQPQTNIKIALFNAKAAQRFKALGFPIIPAFAQTLALTQSTRDVAHYDSQVLQQSTMQFVLGLLCPSS
jgi:hypothetical protein